MPLAEDPRKRADAELIAEAWGHEPDGMSDIELYGLLYELGYDWIAAEASWVPGVVDEGTAVPREPRPRRPPLENPAQPRLF